MIEDALYDNHFDINAATQALKAKYPAPQKKPKAPTPSPSPAPAKKAEKPASKYCKDLSSVAFIRLAHFKFFLVVVKVSHTPTFYHHTSNQLHSRQIIMSKLALLAKQRALKKDAAIKDPNEQPLSAQLVAPSSLNLLDKLQAKHEGTPASATPNPSSSASLASKTTASKSSALQKLAARGSQLSQHKSPAPLKIPLLSKQPAKPAPTPQKPARKPSPLSALSIFPDIDYSFTPSPRPARSSSLSIFGASESDSDDDLISCSKSYNPAQLSNFLYPLESTSAVGQSFSKPSPDDIVISAQSQSKGFVDDAAAKSIAALKIDSPPVKELKYNVLEEIKKTTSSKKPILCFVVIGHVDAGKSTLMGRLLLDSGAVSKHTVAKFEKASKEIGKQSFALAWVMDKTDEERSRGITVDVCSSIFETKTRHFTILDAPGHRDFVPNMIEGSSRADSALLVVDAGPNAFESGFYSDGQTREHAIVARSLGIEQLVVAVNKLDVLNWSEARFRTVEEQLSDFLVRIGFKSSAVTFVPCSGLTGENVVKNDKLPKDLADWYKGPTVLEALETQKLPPRNYEAPFRLRVIDVDTVPHTTQAIVSGRVDYGTVQENQQLAIVPAPPSGKIPYVKTIYNYDRTRETLPWAKAGDYVEIVLGGVTTEDLHTGDFLCRADAPVGYTKKFTAKLSIFETDKPILKGNTMVMHYAGSRAEVQITKLVALLDKTGAVVGKGAPRLLKGGQSGIVHITVLNGKAIPLESYKENRDLGRIILRREGSTIAVGIVEDLTVHKKSEE